MYSPFVDRKGKQLTLDKVRFIHLPQLKEIDEGYKVEYKSELSDEVKKKIPAIITSFANSSGGWLIIGIDNETHNVRCIPKLRADYDQIISQLLSAHVDPIPEYSSKYIRNPNNGKEGVLAVFIPEGRLTPYIADGTVYVRNGSSKEPIKSERATIDRLYQKTTVLQAEIDSFCTRNVHFSPDRFRDGVGKITYPICNIYFKNISEDRSVFSGKFEQVYDYVKTTEMQGLFKCKQYTFDSIVLRHLPLDPSENGVTLTLELFKDASAKIHVPMISNNEEQNKAIAELTKHHLIRGAGLKVCSGVDTFDCVTSALYVLECIYSRFDIKKAGFVLRFEFENAGNTALFFEGSTYIEDAKQNGLRVCCRDYSKSPLIYLKDYPDLTYANVIDSLAYDYFMTEFGFPQDVSCTIVQEASKIRYPQNELPH